MGVGMISNIDDVLIGNIFKASLVSEITLTYGGNYTWQHSN